MDSHPAHALFFSSPSNKLFWSITAHCSSGIAVIITADLNWLSITHYTELLCNCKLNFCDMFCIFLFMHLTNLPSLILASFSTVLVYCTSSLCITTCTTFWMFNIILHDFILFALAHLRKNFPPLMWNHILTLLSCMLHTRAL